MSTDDHKYIENMRIAHEADPTIPVNIEDRDHLYKLAGVELALFPPAKRIAYIAKVAQAIEDDANNVDDSGRPTKPGDLRRRSQLLSLKRQLEADHEFLLKKAGR